MRTVAYLQCLLLLLTPVNGLKSLSTTQSIRQPTSLALTSSYNPPPRYPPPPPFDPKPLPVILGGGLFLFGRSVPRQHQPFAEAVLEQAQRALRNDATIGMELGLGVETGGVYASTFATTGSYDQLVLQFQIEGGNAWAQGVAYGARSRNNNKRIRLVSLSVANMDASMNGTPFEVQIPAPIVEEN